MSANDRQVGGSHYKGGYEHWDFVTNVGMSYLGAQVCKYLKRWRDKNGREDVEKAGHFLDKMIEVSPILIMQKLNIPIDYINGELNSYLHINGIKGEEAAVTSILATWSSKGHLQMAKCYIETLVMKIPQGHATINRGGGGGYASRPDSDESVHGNRS